MKGSEGGGRIINGGGGDVMGKEEVEGKGET